MYLQVLQKGKMEYFSCLEFQKRLLSDRQQGRIPNTLILVVHPPVITIGRNGSYLNIKASPKKLKEMGICVYEINRGGDVAYHGPGQLVGYPIIDLKEYGRDVHVYYSFLEQVIIDFLKKYNIRAGRNISYPGVWVGSKKIAAIGIAVKKWVTMHGFALNIYPDPLHTELTIPCGIADRGITCLKECTSQVVNAARINIEIVESFARVFNLKPIFKGAANLESYKITELNETNRTIKNPTPLADH